MEDIKKAKNLINRINRKCDKENICLFDALEKMKFTSNKYLEIIGLNPKVMNNFMMDEVNSLFQLSDTRVLIPSSIESLENVEIEIYSISSSKIVHFLKNKIKFDKWEYSKDNSYVYEDGYTYIVCPDKEISYNIITMTKIEEYKSRLITEKYPIKYMYIKVNCCFNNIEKSYEVTINDDMLKSDLNKVIRLLNRFGFVEAFIILNNYPSGIKVIGKTNEVCLK